MAVQCSRSTIHSSIIDTHTYRIVEATNPITSIERMSLAILDK